MHSPLVDVTIPVHSASRPIGRAVRSVIDHTGAAVRVTVVAHNIEPTIIRANLGELVANENVRLLELHDDVPSPSGPFNLGLAESTAPFATIMGSDDELEPGALDSWLALQRRTGAAFVIARMAHRSRADAAHPPVRPFRQTRLDGARDRLSYRSAPLGLLSRAVFGELRFTEGLPSGEDVAFVTRMWFSGAPLAFDRTGPAYLENDDATDRVSFTLRSVADDFAFLDDVFRASWYADLTPTQTEAVAVKMLRSHVFDAIGNRLTPEAYTGQAIGELGEVVRRVVATAPRVERLLSRVDRSLLDGVLRKTMSIEDARALIVGRSNRVSLDTVLTRNPLYALARQAPLRTFMGMALVARPRRR
ncbi:MAG: glycosyltransferase family 2 protein [Microbacteriaceae bacterium]|nr:glycosyltransferase family 2 protein [Microbacteriaceae bacterium]HOY82394.1 glycosyltransferase family A protein [Rhodoglobus sp.]HPM51494.1 glycosyltransferase family A protein [Rhodoglobus sp.]HQG69100.1 glycosyltransferase family A protein [Rhodoglobus sp.]HQJ33569.1 glycosyltransferase family A protein [Rhodoglobus sp.]